MLAHLLTLVALFAAIMSGMTGLGGGTLLIAVLYAVGLAPTVAVPLHAGVQLVSNASRTLAYLGHVNWRAMGLFMLGAGPAPFLVTPFITGINADVLRLGMALFVLMAIWPDWLKRFRLQDNGGLIIAGTISGGLGMLVGATGLLTAPFFLRDNWSKETIIATMAVCQSAAYVVKITAFSTLGFSLCAHAKFLIPMAIAAVIGTFIGRRLVNVFSEQTFRIIFRGMLMALAAKLAWSGAHGLLAG